MGFYRLFVFANFTHIRSHPRILLVSLLVSKGALLVSASMLMGTQLNASCRNGGEEGVGTSVVAAVDTPPVLELAASGRHPANRLNAQAAPAHEAVADRTAS